MKRLMKKFEDIMVSITFAEAGEYDSLKELFSDKKIEITAENKGGKGAVQPVKGAA
jgi:hypothetical protein